MPESKELKIAATIENKIFTIRGQKVMIDHDLAELYEVQVKALNQAVKRNIERFPQEFMFQLTDKEWVDLRSQIVTFNKNSRKYKPYAFTEHGILMLSSVLNSSRAIEINIQIMKIFVKMRQYLLTQINPIEQITELRKLLMLHIENCENRFDEHDRAIRHIMRVLNNLIKEPPETLQIGFTVN